ncbi:MAG: CBS domain-containing protein [Desulfarculus sp.]|nr:CBS domain-containing protein [Desulfarculus sp.]
MKIKHWMTSNPLTVKPDTPLMDAAKLMREHQIRRLPVVERGKVVGMLTHRNIMEASPSAATSLSVWELNYLMSKLTVAEVMRKDPICVSPEDSVMEVIQTGHQQGIGAFPVVERGRLVGIVTETEIYQAVVALFGDPRRDSFIELENLQLDQRIGAMSRIAGIIESHNLPVMAMFSMPQRRRAGHQRLYIRVQGKKIDAAVKDLQAQGYKVAE